MIKPGIVDDGTILDQTYFVVKSRTLMNANGMQAYDGSKVLSVPQTKPAQPQNAIRLMTRTITIVLACVSTTSR